jgi:DNA-directed RNA polymerase subunit beta
VRDRRSPSARVRAINQSDHPADLTLGITEVNVVDTKDDDTIIKSIKRIRRTMRKRLLRIFTAGCPAILQPWPTRAGCKRLFFDPKKYDLGRVGRTRYQKLEIEVDPPSGR